MYIIYPWSQLEDSDFADDLDLLSHCHRYMLEKKKTAAKHNIKRGELWSRGRAPDSIEGTVVQSHLPPFRNLGNFVYFIFACLSEETLNAGGPFYLLSMPGEVKDPTQGVNV